MHAQFQSNFHGRSAVAGIKSMPQTMAAQGGQSFGKLHNRLMSQAAEHDVIQLLGLIANCLHQMRVAMSKQIHPPGADGVQIGIAVDII